MAQNPAPPWQWYVAAAIAAFFAAGAFRIADVPIYLGAGIALAAAAVFCLVMGIRAQAGKRSGKSESQ